MQVKWWMIALALLLAFLLYVGLSPIDIGGLERARRTACLNNTFQIGRAMMYYAEEHKGQYPPSFGVLIKQDCFTTWRVFVCPSSKDRIPDEFQDNGPYRIDRAKEVDLEVLNRVEVWGSYVMVKGLKHANRPDVIVVYEKPGHHQGAGRNCFFDDGHCVWLSETEFQERIKAQESKLREMNAKEIK